MAFRLLYIHIYESVEYEKSPVASAIYFYNTRLAMPMRASSAASADSA
jgi:hypothetical protein